MTNGAIRNLVSLIGGVMIFKGTESYIPATVFEKYGWALILAGFIFIFYLSEKLQEIVVK